MTPVCTLSYLKPVTITFIINALFAGNKAKGQISKWVFQENKVRKNFPKNEPFLKHSFWDSPFCLITDVFRIIDKTTKKQPVKERGKSIQI